VAHLTRLDHAVNCRRPLSLGRQRMEDGWGSRLRRRGRPRARQGGAGPPGGAHRLRRPPGGRRAPHRLPRSRRAPQTADAEPDADLASSRSPELDAERTLARAVGMLVPQHVPFVVVLTDPDLQAAASTSCRRTSPSSADPGRLRPLAGAPEDGRRPPPPGRPGRRGRPRRGGPGAVNGYLEVNGGSSCDGNLPPPRSFAVERFVRDRSDRCAGWRSSSMWRIAPRARAGPERIRELVRLYRLRRQI